MSRDTRPEPWLRGPIKDVSPLLAPVLYAFAQASEDLEHWTTSLTDQQIWERPRGLTPIGFHLRHIAGSVERLMTYVIGGQLTEAQLTSLRTELDAGERRDVLLKTIHQAFEAAETTIRSIDPAALIETRGIGRKHLPSTVAGLLTHIAEHTQRHVGEVIVTAKLLRA